MKEIGTIKKQALQSQIQQHQVEMKQALQNQIQQHQVEMKQQHQIIMTIIVETIMEIIMEVTIIQIMGKENIQENLI